MPEPISTAWSVGKTLFDILQFVDGKFTDKDAEIYDKFLTELTDYRFLTNPYEVEYAGSVIASAANLRKLIVSKTVDLKQNSKLKGVFFVLGEITRHFLTTVTQIEQEIRSELILTEKNLSTQAINAVTHSSSIEFLEHWKSQGYPEKILRDNFNLNVMRIEYQGHRMRFTEALGELWDWHWKFCARQL
jgi:hypothetical protein